MKNRFMSRIALVFILFSEYSLAQFPSERKLEEIVSSMQCPEEVTKEKLEAFVEQIKVILAEKNPSFKNFRKMVGSEREYFLKKVRTTYKLTDVDKEKIELRFDFELDADILEANVARKCYIKVEAKFPDMIDFPTFYIPYEGDKPTAKWLILAPDVCVHWFPEDFESESDEDNKSEGGK